MKQTGIKVNDKVFFAEEKTPYTVKAFDGRFAICTRPYNFKSTVFYTIIDFKECIRGTNNLVFNLYDYKIQEDIDKCLKDLKNGKTEITRRNRVELDIIKVVRPPKKPVDMKCLSCNITFKSNNISRHNKGVRHKANVEKKLKVFKSRLATNQGEYKEQY